MHNKYLLNECIYSEVDGIFVQLSHLTNVHRGSMIAKKKKKLLSWPHSLNVSMIYLAL